MEDQGAWLMQKVLFKCCKIQLIDMETSETDNTINFGQKYTF